MSPATKHTPSPNIRRPTGARPPSDTEGSRNEDGQALVEFTLVLPIVLLILFGIVWFGIALNDWIDETQIASEAARFAAVDSEHGTGPLTETTFLAWIKKQGDNSEVEGAKPEICSPTSAVGSYVRVKLSYAYNWLPILGLSSTSTNLTSTATMRIEVPPSSPYKTTFADDKPECE